MYIFGKSQIFGSDIFIQFLLRLPLPRKFSVDHLIKKHSNRPNVTFCRKFVWPQNLGAHIKGSSQQSERVYLLHVHTFKAPRKSEVAYKSFFVFEHYICWLDVAVNYLILVQFLKAAHYLQQKINSLIQIQNIVFWIQIGLQVTLRTILQNQKNWLLTLNHVYHRNYVLVLNLLQNIYLSLKQLQLLIWFHHLLQIQNLHCNQLLCLHVVT